MKTERIIRSENKKIRILKNNIILIQKTFGGEIFKYELFRLYFANLDKSFPMLYKASIPIKYKKYSVKYQTMWINHNNNFFKLIKDYL
jgi:hypothetical protein